MLDEGKLRRVAELLREHQMKLPASQDFEVSYYLDRADESFYQTTDLDRIVQDDNFSGREITRLIAQLTEKARDTHQDETKRTDRGPTFWASVSFQREGDVSVRVIAGGKSRDWCVLLAEDLDGQLARVFVGGKLQRLLASGKVERLGVLTLLGGFLAVLASMAWTSPPDSKAKVLAGSLEDKVDFLVSRQLDITSSRGALTGVLFVVLFLLLLESRLITRVFAEMSQSVFCWGDQRSAWEQRQAWLDKVKWGVVVAFAVSIVSSVVAGFLLP